MIHCIGDSHASLFSGFGTRDETYMIPIYPALGVNNDPMFRAYRLGPATAYNLENKLPIINDILNKFVNKNEDSVLLAFGEIDMRIHVGTQLLENPDRTKEQIIQEIVDRYFSTVLKINMQGYLIIILAPLAQSFSNENSNYIKDGFKYPMEFPIIGTNKERNEYTKIFTNLLIEKNKKWATLSENINKPIEIISILDEMLDENGETKPDLFMDYLHLSSIALPLIKSKL